MTTTKLLKRGNQGLKGRLLEKSIEAFMLSLETINRLSIKYRIETFSFLICNAWELLLKAKIIEDCKKREAIYYPQRRGEARRSLSLRDCISKVFPNDTDLIRRNLERVVELRDESVHLVISRVPKIVLSLFQSSVLNYHKQLVRWFGITLSDRIPVGMMTIVYDFHPEQFDLTSVVMKRELGREAINYLTSFQESIVKEAESLNKPVEFTIDINYKLALVQKVGEADIVLAKGSSGIMGNVVEVPKDPSKTHPYRQKEVINLCNEALSGITRINQFDILCVVKVYGIKKRSEFYYKGAILGSPTQFSHSFVEWLIKEFKKDKNFFIHVRNKAKSLPS